MSNANRDYVIVYDVKNSSLALSRPLNFYITDKNTSNIFVKLVTKVAVENGIDQYTDIENASNYVLTMRVIKPNNEVKSLEATQHEEESIFQFDLTEDFKDMPGKYICELTISTIVSARQELITSDPFNYEVKRSILSNVGEIIETEDTTVEKLLNDLNATKAELSSQIKEIANKKIFLNSNNVDLLYSVDNNSTVYIEADIAINRCNISNKSNITFTSTNNSTITINEDGFNISSCDNIVFSNLNIKGNLNYNAIVNDSGVATNIIIDKCKFSDINSAFLSHGVNNLSITNCNINNTNSDAIDVLNNPFNINISNNNITNVIGIGIKLYSSSTDNSYNIKINNNYINHITKGTSGYGMGIEVNENSYDIECNNNIVNNATCMGISLSGVKKGVCCGNKIENIVGGYGTGIELVSTIDCTCNNNIIINTSQHGVILDKITNNAFVGNIIKQPIKTNWDNELFCITIGGGATLNDAVISSNKLIGATYGIVLKNNIKNIKITDNQFVDTFSDSISNHATTNSKFNIYIMNNILKSINIKYGTNYKITNNIFQGKGTETAININNNMDNCIIAHNSVSDLNRFIYIYNVEENENDKKPTNIIVDNNSSYNVTTFIQNDDSTLTIKGENNIY